MPQDQPIGTLTPDQLGITDVSGLNPAWLKQQPDPNAKPMPSTQRVKQAPSPPIMAAGIDGETRVAAAPATIPARPTRPATQPPPPLSTGNTPGPYRLGQTIQRNGQTYHVTGIDPANPNNPSVQLGRGPDGEQQQQRQEPATGRVTGAQQLGPDAAALLRSDPDRYRPEMEARYGKDAVERALSGEASPTEHYTPSGLQVRTQLVDFFQGKGVKPHVAQGIADAVGIESSFDPSAKGDDGTSYGLFQAHAERALGPEGLLKLANWQDPNVQFNWAWQQTHGGDKEATAHWNEVMKAPDRSTAMTLWRRYFERPASDDFTLVGTGIGREWLRAIKQQSADAEAEMNALLNQVNKMTPGSTEHRELLDALLKKQLQMMDVREQMALHPPQKTVGNMLSNFGSLAVLIGIFGGMRSGAPLTASLSAAGDAMNAINARDQKAYDDAFKAWETQTSVLGQVIGDEANMYKNVLEDDKLTEKERWDKINTLASIYGNKMIADKAAVGDYKGMVDGIATLDKARTEMAKEQAALSALHEKSQARQDAIDLGDRQYEEWVAADPGRQKLPDTEKLVMKTKLEQAQLRAAGLLKGGADKGATDDYLGPGEERAALRTQLGVMAEEEARSAKSGQTPRTADELAKDPKAVAAARRKIEEEKALARQGAPITDDAARMVAAQWLKGDPSGLVRMSPQSRGKVQEAALEEVMPQMVSQFRREEGRAPTEAERRELVTQVGVQLASSRAQFVGFTQYQRTLAIRQAAIDNAITEAQKIIPIALAASEKVGRTSFPDLNAALQSGKYRAGDPDVVQFVAATNTLLNVYSRAVTPTGQATDMVRNMARDQLSAVYSPEQYRAAVQIMELEMDNAQAAPEEVRRRRAEEFVRSGSFKPDDTTPFLQHGVGGMDGKAQPGSSSGNPVVLKSRQDYQALPKGAYYQDSDGSIKRK